MSTRGPLGLGLLLVSGLIVGSCGDGPVEPEPFGSIVRFEVTLNGTAVVTRADATEDTIPLVGVVGELDLAQPFDSTSANGVNAVDVGLFTTPAPATGVPGVRFATNTRLVAPNTVAATGADVADVTRAGNPEEVQATLLTAVVGGPCTTLPTDNVLAADSVYKMVAGVALISVSSASVDGSVSFEGAPCDGVSATTTVLTATFNGTRMP